MTPQIITTGNESPEHTQLEELYIRQVEDRSLPAQEVLIEQQESAAPDQSPLLFVP